MAEQQPQPIQARDAQQPPRVYRGRPENQKDPQVRNAFQGQAQVRGPPRRNQPRPPPGLPKPTRVADDAQRPAQRVVERSPMADSIFGEDVSVREVNLRTLQKPSFTASVEIARLSFQQMLVDEPNLSKVWTTEAYEYYSTAMLWLRIINLKAKNSQGLTQAEESILQVSSIQTYNLSEPLRLYLTSIGNVTSKTGQHLYPEFPELPTTQVDSLPGTYGRINAHSHNNYEEVPALGIHVGMIRATLSPDNPIPQWTPPILPAHMEPTENLLGFHRIRRPRMEATAIFDAAGITNTSFPNHPPQTGFNFNLLRSVSAVLANNKTFKITPVNFMTLSEAGSNSQLIIERPIDLCDPTVRNVNAELRAESLTHKTTGMYGMAVTFCYQMYKEPADNDHSVWCCIRPTANHAIPDQYINNRNTNRNIPEYYKSRVFNTVSLVSGDYRSKMVERLVTAKR